ncbi:5824_t:CDS:2, partial [Funneliformis geosporum]
IYANTEDFLMVSTLTNGKTLEDPMGKFPPFGPKLISLLETLGVIEIVTGPQQTIPPTNDNPSQNNNR